jgi:hypothetical protein
MSESTALLEPSPAPDFDFFASAGRRAWKAGELAHLWQALTKHASQEGFRYNICGVRVVNGSAAATDGHRLLVVNDIAKGTADATYAVERGRITLQTIESQFPDIGKVVSPATMALEPKRYVVSRFGKLRKLALTTPARLTADGILLGSAAGEGINLRYLSQVPYTDEELTIEVRGERNPILIRPALGGWIALVMPMRIDGDDAFLREMRHG